MLDVGATAPDFSAEATNGAAVSLRDFDGQYLVLYFYPKAFTPGCTKEARRFRDNYPEIRALGGEVVGVSMDDLAVQCRFAESEQVTYPLLPDPSGALALKFGVRRMLFPVAKRVTFLIGPDKRVAARFVHEFQVNRHLDDVLSFLRAHQQAVPGAATPGA